MRNDWILDVLGDLRTFAEENDLLNTASQLADASVIFLAEASQDAMSEHVNNVRLGEDGIECDDRGQQTGRVHKLYSNP